MNTELLLARVAIVGADILWGYKISKGATVMCNARFETKAHHVKEEMRSQSCCPGGKSREEAEFGRLPAIEVVGEE